MAKPVKSKKPGPSIAAANRRSDPKIAGDNPLNAIQADEVTWVLRDVLRGYVDTNTAFGAKLDLSVNDMTAIEYLLEDSELGPVELGQRLGIRSASATAMVDRLETAGHLQRQPHPTDRRRRTLKVTESASQSLMETVAPLVGDLASIAESLSSAERTVVHDYLLAVVRTLKNHAER
jgi:DNA-binding MarR family transcriptional regulator